MQFFTRQKYTYPEYLGHVLITFFCNYFIFSMLHLLKKVNQQFGKNKKTMIWMLIWVPPFTSFTVDWWAGLYAAHHSAKRISVERKLLHSRVNIYIITYILAYSLLCGNAHHFYCPHSGADTLKLPFFLRRGGRRPG